MRPLVAFLVLFLTAPAAAELCTPITSVPVALTVPGTYCAAGHLTFPALSGTAITVYADFVTVDLAGFALEGTAGPGSMSTGVAAYAGRRGLTVKNGTISGFLFGVRVDDGPASAVRNILFLNNWYIGPSIKGAGAEVSGCRVVNTGGSTLPGFNRPLAIVASGTGVRVVDNTVAGMTMQPGCTSTVCEVVGLSMDDASGGLVRGNNFSLATTTPQSYAIWVNGASTMLTVDDNVFARWGWGLVCAQGVSGYSANAVFGVAEPFSPGCVNLADSP